MNEDILVSLHDGETIRRISQHLLSSETGTENEMVINMVGALKDSKISDLQFHCHSLFERRGATSTNSSAIVTEAYCGLIRSVILISTQIVQNETCAVLHITILLIDLYGGFITF